MTSVMHLMFEQVIENAKEAVSLTHFSRPASGFDRKTLERFIDFSVRIPNPANERKSTQTRSVRTITLMLIARIAKTASATAILSCWTSRKYCLLLSLLSTPLLGVRKKKPGLPLIPCKKPMQMAVVMHELV